MSGQTSTSSRPRMLRASAFCFPHALIEDGVYTVVQQAGSLNRTQFPSIPKEPMLPSTSPILPQFELGWIPNEHPFMLFIPQHPPFYGPLFDRLGFHHRNIPVARIRANCFTLPEEIKVEWISLERNLKAIVSAMVEIFSVPLPKFFHFWPFPKRYGYELMYSSRESVQIVALRSRNAFIPLMAAITFFLIILNDQEMSVPGFTWRDRVLNKTKIHHQWLSMLEGSVVGDLMEPRIGGIIDMEECEYRALIPLFTKAKLNLYLCWGKITDAPMRPPKFLSDNNLVPDHHVIRRLHYISKNPPCSPTETPQPGPSWSVEISEQWSFPGVDPDSKQKSAQTWQEFFARRQESNLRMLEHETDKQRQSRYAREESARKHQMPGNRGPTVFIWEDVNGFRIRRLVSRKRVEDMWNDYSDAQRKYDAFRNEWDICTEFGDPNSDDSDDDLHSFWWNGPQKTLTNTNDDNPEDNQLPHEIPSQLLPIDEEDPDNLEGHFSSRADLGRVYSDEGNSNQLDGTTDTTQPCPTMIVEPFEQTAYHRFGFSWAAPVATPPFQMSWDLASKILGSGHWLKDSADFPFPLEDIQNKICRFLGYLWVKQDKNSIPHDILDVHQLGSNLWKAQRTLRVWIQKFGNDWYYFIRPWDCVDRDSAKMELGLTSAATVLELFRRCLGPDLDSVAEFLLDRGVPFNTFIRSNLTPHKLTELHPRNIVRLYQGLGFRPSGYVPDSIDYKAYVSTRNRFLRTSRCRAALLKGGLVARIAKDVVPYSEVFYGPSEAVLDEGFCLWDKEDSSPRYWDDQLNEDELDKICGVYKVATGQFENGIPQTSDLSWWPKPSIWEKSGLNVGYWSEDCERWYQFHLGKCLDGTALLRNPANWKRSLRLTKEVSEIVKKNETLSTESLAHIETTNMISAINSILPNLLPFDT